MTATEIPFTALFLEPDSAPLPPHKYTPSHSAPTERFPSPKPTRTPPSRFACSSSTKSRRSGPARSTRSPTAPSPFAACSAPETTHCPPTPLPTGSGSPAPGTPLTVSSTPPSPVWFRDHAAYCGMAMTAQGGLLAIFAKLGARPDRRPVTNRPLAAAQPLHSRLASRPGSASADVRHSETRRRRGRHLRRGRNRLHPRRGRKNRGEPIAASAILKKFFRI